MGLSERLVVEEVEDQHDSASQPLHHEDPAHKEATQGVGLFGMVGADEIATQNLHGQSAMETEETAQGSPQTSEDKPLDKTASVDSTGTEIGPDIQDERKQEGVLEFLDRLEEQGTPLHTPSDVVGSNTMAARDLESDACDTREDVQVHATSEMSENRDQPQQCASQSPSPPQAATPGEDVSQKQVETLDSQDRKLETSMEQLRNVPPKAAIQLVERCFELPPSQFKSLYADPRPRHFVSPKSMPPSPFAAVRDILQQREVLEEERKLRTQQLSSTSLDSKSFQLTSLREQLRIFLRSSEWHRDELRRRLITSHSELSMTLTEQELMKARSMPLRSASTDPNMSRKLNYSTETKQVSHDHNNLTFSPLFA